MTSGILHSIQLQFFQVGCEESRRVDRRLRKMDKGHRGTIPGHWEEKKNEKKKTNTSQEGCGEVHSE